MGGRTGGHRFLDPFPKYLQIREILLRRLETGAKVGDQLPTEATLCDEFGVSRETIREALSGLEQLGYINRTRGQGTFVAKLPAKRTERRLTGMSEDYSRFGLDTRAQVLEHAPVVPPAAVADVTRLPPGEMVYRILRVRHFEGEPLDVYESFLPLDVGVQISRLDLRNTSIVNELRATLGLRIWEDHQQIEAVAADPQHARLLGVSLGTPLLFVVRHFLTAEDRTIALFWSHYRADRYFYTVKLAQRGEGEAASHHATSGSGRKAARAGVPLPSSKPAPRATPRKDRRRSRS